MRITNIPVRTSLILTLLSLCLIVSPQATMPATSGAQSPILAETTYRGHHYYLLKEMTWQNAEATAVSLGGHLVTINDAAEHEYLWALWGRDHLLWIGLNDVKEEGSYVWVSGQPVTFLNFAADEPNNLGNGEDYVHMWSQFFDSCGRWNDNRALVDELPQRSIVELDSVRTSNPPGPE